MEDLLIGKFFDQKKLSSHLIFFLFSLAVIGLVIAVRNDFNGWVKYLASFGVVFMQLEIFVFIGMKIFRGFAPSATPKVFTRRILSRFLLFYVICFVVAFIIMMEVQYIASIVQKKEPGEIIRNFFNFEFRSWLRTTLAGLSVGALLFVFFLWQDALKREQKQREEKLVFQHETLKSQVNPHFLFNSLNTISSLIQTQPGTAEKFVKDLSSVYRYILENSQKDKVSLQSELDFVKNFFELHRVRGEEKYILSIDAPDLEKYNIMPVSLQILAENAIKHNIATRYYPLRIDIYIEGSYIVVKNNLQLKASQLQPTRTGLKNLAERTELLSGTELIIEQTNTYFIVKLPLLQ